MSVMFFRTTDNIIPIWYSEGWIQGLYFNRKKKKKDITCWSWGSVPFILYSTLYQKSCKFGNTALLADEFLVICFFFFLWTFLIRQLAVQFRLTKNSIFDYPFSAFNTVFDSFKNKNSRSGPQQGMHCSTFESFVLIPICKITLLSLIIIFCSLVVLVTIIHIFNSFFI